MVAGSKFHNTRRRGNSITISRAQDSSEGAVEFDKIVDEAVANSFKEGYEVIKHRTSVHGSARYDSAAIISSMAARSADDFRRVESKEKRNRRQGGGLSLHSTLE